LEQSSLCLEPIEHRLRDQTHPSRAAPEALRVYGGILAHHEAIRDAHAARYCQLDVRSAQLPQVQQPSSSSKSAYEGSTGRIAPGYEGAIAGHAILPGGKTVTAELKVIVDRSVTGKKLLGLPD
jgi:hypothetical protein